MRVSSAAVVEAHAVVEAQATCSCGVLIPKQRDRVAVRGQALADAGGMRRQTRPISVKSASKDTVRHEVTNISD